MLLVKRKETHEKARKLACSATPFCVPQSNTRLGQFSAHNPCKGAPMTSRNVVGGRALPPNPEFLDFERTDGDAKQWPTNTKEVVGGDGQVNYMKPLGPDDSSDIHWRCQVAIKVAERLGKPCTCLIHSQHLSRGQF